MKTMRLRTALMGSGAAIAMIAASGSAGADELQDLKAQIEALQSKVTQLESKQADTGSPNVAPAAAVEAGDKPRSWKLPGTNTSMSIGGYAKLDFIYDVNAPGAGGNQSTGLRAAPQPVAGQGAVQNRFNMHARQSRVFFKTWTPTDWGELATHIEGDFFGGGGNQVVSNSHGLRLRHAYGRLGPVLAGQTWTNFMDLRAFPETVDFAGPNLPFIRQAQLRYSADFGGGTTLDLAVENPQTAPIAQAPAAGAGGAVAAGAVSGASISSDSVPDFTARLTHAWSSGHVALAGVARHLGAETGGVTTTPAYDESTFGYGVSLSGTWVASETDRFGAYGVYGDGIGRYFLGSLNDGIITGPAATGAARDLEAIKAWGLTGYWQHKWTDTIRTNLVGSYSHQDPDENVGGGGVRGFVPAGTFGNEWSVHANLIWSPVPQVNVGFEYQHRFSSYHNSPNGETSRFQMGFQYSF